MTCSENAVKVTEEDKLPGAVCRKGVGSNSIPCQFCRCLVSNRCSGIRSNLRENWNFKCKICLNQQTDIPEAFPGIELNDQSLEIRENICYLGDMIGASMIGLSKFRELVPLLASRGLPLRSRLYSASVQSSNSSKLDLTS